MNRDALVAAQPHPTRPPWGQWGSSASGPPPPEPQTQRLPSPDPGPSPAPCVLPAHPHQSPASESRLPTDRASETCRTAAPAPVSLPRGIPPQPLFLMRDELAVRKLPGSPRRQELRHLQLALHPRGWGPGRRPRAGVCRLGPAGASALAVAGAPASPSWGCVLAALRILPPRAPLVPAGVPQSVLSVPLTQRLCSPGFCPQRTGLCDPLFGRVPVAPVLTGLSTVAGGLAMRYRGNRWPRPLSLFLRGANGDGEGARPGSRPRGWKRGRRSAR